MNTIEELQKLQNLREAGTLTDDEFNQLKARILSTSNQPQQPKVTPASANQFVQTLTRSRTDSWLGGVCGGLAAKTDMPSWVWRLIFTVATFAYSLGAIVYLLLWIFVPLEGTNTGVYNAPATTPLSPAPTNAQNDNVIDANPKE